MENRRNVVTKAPLRVQFLPALGWRGWEEQEALALLSKKGVRREGSVKSQQKFDFFCYLRLIYKPLYPNLHHTV